MADFEKTDKWLAPLGGYVTLPDGTPIVPTDDDKLVRHRVTGQLGRIFNGKFVPEEETPNV